MKITNLSNLPMVGTYSQSFSSPEYYNNGSIIIYGSGCYFGDGFILTTVFRDDLTGHDSSNPNHLNIDRKFENVLICGSICVIQEEAIDGLNNTQYL